MGHFKDKQIILEEDMTSYIKDVKNDIMNLICKGCDKFKDANYTLAVESQVEEILQRRLDQLFKLLLEEKDNDNKNVHTKKEEV
jgi:hypothetical protein